MARVSIADTKKAVSHLDRYGWVSLRQFAHLIKVTYPTAKNMADKKQVRTLPVGGIRRVYRDEVMRCMREGNHATDSTAKQLPKEIRENAQSIINTLMGDKE